MKLCTALKRDGVPCHAKAVLRDPDGHCVWHSSLNSTTTKKTHDLTKEEASRTVGRELRRLRKLKDPSPLQLQRANEMRNLIQLWISLTAAPAVEPPSPKLLTLAEKLKLLESERKEK